jgi:hypothetical protein
MNDNKPKPPPLAQQANPKVIGHKELLLPQYNKSLILDTINLKLRNI